MLRYRSPHRDRVDERSRISTILKKINSFSAASDLECVIASPTAVPVLKRSMRAIWRLAPRSGVSYALGKVLAHSLLRAGSKHQLVPVLFDGRIPMQLDLGDVTSNDLFCLDSHYEAATLKLWKQLARKNRFILDVGSHLGTYALVAADANPQARIVAAEANRDNYTRLRAHGASYPNLRPVHAAVATQAGTMWFCLESNDTGGGCLSSSPVAGRHCYQIQTCSLTALCESEGLPSVDLAKIDVEGYEHELLNDNDEFWRQYRPLHLIVEIARKPANAVATDLLFAAMARRNYRWRRIERLHVVPFGHPDELANWHFWQQ
jgi:FkbM family methyltransferase